ncbi:MAG: selenocysteine-specific translation elongation factor [Omnitrophica WOR_2 bacterium]
MRVIGTAGHVDHGKSTLVEALTGTHPDRLKEEREREMTIDLGFAWMVLPDGEEIGIVDVPGHRDFIENMLAGVGGIDAALFVIAADEGVMPQTREHLSILDILQIQGGVVALTKIDMVDDAEWLDLVEEEVRQALAGTVLEGTPILHVSARTGAGLPELIEAIQERLKAHPPRQDHGRPRLPVDRIFTLPGFGTVVTGTLTDGRLQVGDEIEILPGGLRGRVRGLQTHKRKEDVAIPGSRTAVNISGINVTQVARGDVVAHPGDYQPARRLDVRFRLLPDASQPLLHNTEVKFFIGAKEVLARVRLLGTENLKPGEEGWLQLELMSPVVAVRGDRYILRRPSPGETLGGGVVVDPQPKGRHRRFNQETLAQLESLAKGTPGEVLNQALIALGSAPLQEVLVRSNLEDTFARQALDELVRSGELVDLEGKNQAIPAETGVNPSIAPSSLVTSRITVSQVSGQIRKEVEAFHRAYPLRRGMPKEELKSRLKSVSQGAYFNRFYIAMLKKLVVEGVIEESGPLVNLPGHTIQFNSQQQNQVNRLLADYAAHPFAPPSVKESQAAVGEEMFAALLELGQLVQLSPEVVFRREDYDRMLVQLKQILEKQGTITAAQVRDYFNTSRKYVLAFLEYTDRANITVREGDFRRLKK